MDATATPSVRPELEALRNSIEGVIRDVLGYPEDIEWDDSTPMRVYNALKYMDDRYRALLARCDEIAELHATAERRVRELTHELDISVGASLRPVSE